MLPKIKVYAGRIADMGAKSIAVMTGIILWVILALVLIGYSAQGLTQALFPTVQHTQVEGDYYGVILNDAGVIVKVVNIEGVSDLPVVMTDETDTVSVKADEELITFESHSYDDDYVNLEIYSPVSVYGETYEVMASVGGFFSIADAVRHYNAVATTSGWEDKLTSDYLSLIDFVLPDISDQIGAALTSGSFPTLDIAPNGHEDKTPNPGIAASFNAGLTPEEARKADPTGSFPPFDFLEYDFECATVGLTITNEQAFLDALAAITGSKADTGRVYLGSDSIDVTTPEPCGLREGTPPPTETAPPIDPDSVTIEES